ncbi:MAG TPA: hypothetical protein DCF44_03915 [Chitinophagaceae bacterium]|nr:hypothetical protein [Chitinophagaceae bacterium]
MKKIIYILILFNLAFSRAQNLVPNSDFELFTNCPTTLDQLSNSTGWTSYRGSPDYFNACNTSTNALGVPSNAVGYQSAFSGDAYAGFVAFATGGEAREILGITLNQTLIVGQTYFVSFYISLAEYDANLQQYIARNKIGARFSTVPANGSDNPYPGTNPFPIDNFAHIYTNTIINDTMNWVKIQGTFLADSAYEYLMIGNFFDDSNTDTIYRANGVRSYYFVDEICVSTSSNTCNQISNSITKYKSSDIIEIFPNPATSFLIIDCKGMALNKMFIYNSFNEILSSSTFDNKLQIDLSQFPNGVYFLKVQFRDRSLTKKIIINH